MTTPPNVTSRWPGLAATTASVLPTRRPGSPERAAKRRPAKVTDADTLVGMPLTLREREALTWSAIGKTAQETADIMNIARQTATLHLNNAAAKLGCSRTIQAVTAALRAGLLIDIDARMRLNPQQVPALSQVEIDHLLWGAEGKTAWETSKILDTKETTVTFHLKAATRKLGCANKIQAVAAAIRMGLI